MPTNQTNSRNALWQALGYAWQFGYTIAVPLVVLALGGRLLDRKFGTAPWLFLAGIIISIVISTTLLIIRASRIFKSIDRIADSNQPAKGPGPNQSNRPESTHHDHLT